MTPNDIDAKYEQFMADAPTSNIVDEEYERFKADTEPMGVDECIDALNVAEYTATTDEPFPKTFHLTDDFAFLRLVELARMASEFKVGDLVIKAGECISELEAQLVDMRAERDAARAEIVKWREACFKARESGVRALMEIEKLEGER